jgi:hypothetical protein
MGGKVMTRGRKGRPSYDDYAKSVAEALRFDVFELEECTSLAQMPGVKALLPRYQHAILPIGATLRAMFDKVVADIEKLAKFSNDPLMLRIATFLQIWYREHGTVVRAAQVLGVSRSTVVHTAQPRAIELVARRFLEMAMRSDLSA